MGAILVLTVSQLQAQSGRVGINTASPAAILHVADSSVVFSKSGTTVDGGPNPPISTAGSRMMWFSPANAFRAGAVSGLQWSRDSIGGNSFASGINSVALGYSSFAHGNNSRASGNYSTALGNVCQATGNSSVAMGNQNLASGSNSVALGTSNIASTFSCISLGNNTEASTQYSFASGSGTKAYGSYGVAAAAFNYESKASGAYSSSFGFRTTAQAYASFVIGRYNVIDGLDYSWYNPDPLFVIGNGDSLASPRNALTLEKNGNMGLFTPDPSYRLHVANDNFNDGGHLEGIMIENTNTVTPGEAALSFRNKSMPGNRQWMIGINETIPHLSFAYGTSFTAANTHMTFDTMGRMGVNTTSPQAMLHVIRNNPSGGPFNANSIAVFESNNISYVQLSSENADETGFLSGNEVTQIRSAIIFVADSSIDVRAGGNGTDLKISKAGNVGIGTYTPTDKLHVNGTVKLGINGTAVTEVIKATVNVNLPSIAGGGTLAQTYSVTNAALTSAVSVSPELLLNAGIVVASSRVSSAGNVEVRFVNTTAGPIDVPAMDYHFTIIR